MVPSMSALVRRMDASGQPEPQYALSPTDARRPRGPRQPQSISRIPPDRSPSTVAVVRQQRPRGAHGTDASGRLVPEPVRRGQRRVQPRSVLGRHLATIAVEVNGSPYSQQRSVNHFSRSIITLYALSKTSLANEV